MAKPDKEWFLRKLEEHRMSMAGLGRILGVDRSTVSLTLSGKRRVTTAKAADIARIFGVTTSEVIKRLGTSIEGIKADDEPGIRVVPLDGWIDENGVVKLDSRLRKPRVDAGNTVESGAFALQWRTAQTPLHPFDGWLTVLGARREADVDAMNGRVCVVGLPSGDVVIRAVRRGYTPGTFTLSSINQPDDVDVEVTWYAPVVLMRPAV